MLHNSKCQRMLSTLHGKMLSKILTLSAMLMNVESGGPSLWNSLLMGGFYERLISITKMVSKRSIRNLCLTSIQLKKILTEIEAVVNSRILVYVNNEVGYRTIITPMHCLSINTRTGLQTLMIPEEEDDPNFRLKGRKSAEKLLEIWKKSQKHVEHIWKIWKNDHLLSVRERS